MSRWTARAFLTVACGIGVVAVVLAFNTRATQGASAAAAARNAANRSAISNGLLAAQTAALPPPAQRGHRLSGTTAAIIRSGGRANVGRFYTGAALSQRYAAIDSGITEQSGDVAYLDAGVDNIVIGDPVVSGDTATAAGTAEVWLDVGQVQTDGSIAVAHPRNTMVLTFTLILDSGTWKIESQRAGFAPGSEP